MSNRFLQGMVSFLFVIMLTGCELIVLKETTPQKLVIPSDQNSPQGVVYVFKTEIDSANVQGAMKVMASINAGTPRNVTGSIAGMP